MCCSNGKVALPHFESPPDPLLSLVQGIAKYKNMFHLHILKLFHFISLAGDSPQSKHFLSNIRKYNACFQMTSFGATKIVQDGYTPSYKIQGQVYHQAGSLLPVPDTDYKLLQIYFMGQSDDDQQVDQRIFYNNGARRNIVQSLQIFFHQRNELIRLFKVAKDRMLSDDHSIVIRADKTPIGQHERRFNAPTIDEVAIIIVGEEFNSRDIVLHRRNNQLQRICETHPSYDALQYPIIYSKQIDLSYHKY